MAAYIGQRMRRWYTFDYDEVLRAYGIVDDNVVLGLLVSKTSSAMRLETGVVKVHVCDESVEAHPVLRRHYQQWVSKFGSEMFLHTAVTGGVLIRWVKRATDRDGVPGQAMRMYTSILREVFQTVAAPGATLGGGGVSGRKRGSITSLVQMTDADSDLYPEYEPEVVSLKCVRLYCRFEHGAPVEFRARWLNDMSGVPSDGYLEVQSSPGLEKLNYFYLPGSINYPHIVDAGVVTFNSIATVAFPSAAAFEALKHLFVKVVAGRSHATAVAQSHESGSAVHNATFADLTEAEVANATEHVHMNRAEDHVRRQHGVREALELEAQETRNARMEAANIAANPSVPRILRRDPYFVLGPSEMSARSRILVFPSGDSVAAMPMPEPTAEVIAMMQLLRDEISLSCGASAKWLLGEQTSTTATGIRDGQRSFREHVNKYRSFLSTVFSRMFDTAFLNHVSRLKNEVAGVLDAAVQRRARKQVKTENEEQEGDEGAQRDGDGKPALRPVDDALLRAVERDLEIKVAFSQEIDMDIQTLRELRMSDVLDHDQFVRDAITAYNLPREHYDEFVARQEHLREFAKRALTKRDEESKRMDGYIKSATSGDISAVPPSGRAETLFDMQNERRVHTDEANKHLAYFPDPAAFVASNPADLKVFFETSINPPLARPSGLEAVVTGAQNAHVAEEAARAAAASAGPKQG